MKRAVSLVVEGKKLSVQTLTRSDHLDHLKVFWLFALLCILFFSPVLFFHRVLAPYGDAINYYLPNFYSGVTLWEPLLLSGFPLSADPQAMTWYPLSAIGAIGSMSSGFSWNIFVLLAYVLASFFAYGYVRCITDSGLAGLVAGIIYGFSGFMIVHLAHVSMIHVAAWAPLVLWSLEELRRSFSSKWFVIGAIAVGCMTLAGHPQITFYALSLSCGYVLFLEITARKRLTRYIIVAPLMILLGLGLAAIQLIPTLELVRYSLRNHMSFKEFTTFDVPPVQMLQLLFPYLFGGSSSSFYATGYFGQWNLWEVSGYVGLMPITLGLVGILAYRKSALAWFWTLVACVALIAVLGDATPIAKLLYKIPVVNKFRAPGRHYLEWCLAMSVLAGFGVAALQRPNAERLVRLCLFCTFILISGGLVSVWAASSEIGRLAVLSGLPKPKLSPFSNPSLLVPLIIWLTTSLGLFYWCNRSRSKFRIAVLVCLLVVDLGSFGWYEELWRYNSIERTQLESLLAAQPMTKKLSGTGQRLLPVKGVYDPLFAPNFTRLRGIPNASFYGPLLLMRYCELLHMNANGELKGYWYSRSNQALDLMATHYLTLPGKHSDRPSFRGEGEYTWLQEDFNGAIGSDCAGLILDRSLDLAIRPAFKATHLDLVSNLGCSRDVPDGSQVAQVLLIGQQGKILRTIDLRAGLHTSEWSYDAAISPPVVHRRAHIFNTYNYPGTDGVDYVAHDYVTRIDLNGEIAAKEIKLRWVGPKGVIVLKKMTLFNENSSTSRAVDIMSAIVNADPHWQKMSDSDNEGIYENTLAKPRAWLVPEVLTLKPEEVLRSIHTSRLPDGRRFDSSQMALVEKPLEIAHTADLFSSDVVMVESSDLAAKIRITCNREGFLVLSDNYYPGWVATIDGKQTPIIRTNYVMRGVRVPAGDHTVQFSFKPRSLYTGALITAFALLTSVLLLFSKSIISRLRQ